MTETTNAGPGTTMADTYEQFIVPTMAAPWAPHVADSARIAPGDSVLDVGCGTGILARTAAERTGLDAAVSGLDPNDEMLAVARRIRPDINWHQGEASALPFEDASFDVVVSQFVLMFVPDKIAALKEMWRVLAAPGRLAVCVWWESPAYPILADIARVRINDDVAEALMDSFSLGDGEHLLGLFREAGIDEPVLHSREGTGYFDSIDEFVRIEIKGWVDGQLAGGLPEDDYAALVAEARKQLAEYQADDGRGLIPMNAHIVTATKV